MATTLKNALADGKAVTAGTTQTVYTVPASTTATLTGLFLANVTIQDGTPAQINVSAWINRSGTRYYLADEWPVESGGSIEVMEGRMVLEASDALEVASDTANSLDTILSYLEIT